MKILWQVGPKKRGYYRPELVLWNEVTQEDEDNPLNLPRISFMVLWGADPALCPHVGGGGGLPHFPFPLEVYTGGSRWETGRPTSYSKGGELSCPAIRWERDSYLFGTWVTLSGFGRQGSSPLRAYAEWRPGEHPDYSDYARCMADLAGFMGRLYATAHEEAAASAEVTEVSGEVDPLALAAAMPHQGRRRVIRMKAAP